MASKYVPVTTCPPNVAEGHGQKDGVGRAIVERTERARPFHMMRSSARKAQGDGDRLGNQVGEQACAMQMAEVTIQLQMMPHEFRNNNRCICLPCLPFNPPLSPPSLPLLPPCRAGESGGGCGCQGRRREEERGRAWLTPLALTSFDAGRGRRGHAWLLLPNYCLLLVVDNDACWGGEGCCLLHGGTRRDDGEAAGGYCGGCGSKERAVRVWGCWWSAGGGQ